MEYHSDKSNNCDEHTANEILSSEVKIFEKQPLQAENIVSVQKQLSDDESDTDNHKLSNLKNKTGKYELRSQHLKSGPISKKAISSSQMSDDDDIETDEVSLSDTNELKKKKRKILQKRNSKPKHDVSITNSDLSDSDFDISASNDATSLEEDDPKPKSNKPKKDLTNNFNRKKCMKLIKCYDRNISLVQLERIFNCNIKQIRNIIKKRDNISESSELQSNSNSDDDDDESESSNNDSDNIKSLGYSNRQNKFNLEESVQVIKAYDRKLTYHMLSSIFNYNWGQIDSIILNRYEILKAYNQKTYRIGDDEGENEIYILTKNVLNLEQRVKVIEAFDRKVSHDELSKMFDCQQSQIVNIIRNRETILEAYKKVEKIRDIDDTDQKYITHNTLGLKKRVKVIKAYDRKICIAQLARIYNCCIKQVTNIVNMRDTILKAYDELQSKRESEDENEPSNIDSDSDSDSDNDSDNIKSLKNFKHHQNLINLDKSVQIIEAYERKLNYHKISRMFNYNWGIIDKIILNRHKILKDYEQKKIHIGEDEVESELPNNYGHNDTTSDIRLDKYTHRRNILNLEQRVQVIEAFDRNISHRDLSQMFNCNQGQIKTIIRNRERILESYKIKNNYNSNENENDIKSGIKYSNKLSLKKRVKVIKAYDRKLSRSQLGRVFNCHALQIRDIIKKRDQILKSYELQSNSDDKNESASSDIDSDKEKSLKEFANIKNRFHLQKSIQIINAYDRKLTYSKISRMFKYEWGQIDNIILNRNRIVKAKDKKINHLGEVVIDKHKHIMNELTLEQRVQMIEAYDRKVSYCNLSRLFNQSLYTVKRIVKNRERILTTYRANSNCDGGDEGKNNCNGNKSKSSSIINNRENLKLSCDTLENQYTNNIQSEKLSLLSHDIPSNTNRKHYTGLQKPDDGIIQVFLENNNESQPLLIRSNTKNATPILFENLQLSNYKDVSIALKPIEDYAKLIKNYNAIKLVTQLHEHLRTVNS